MAFSKKPKKPKKPKIIREILPDEDLTALAREVIEKEKIFLSVPEPKIEFLIVKPYISKKIVARCIKANQELKYFSSKQKSKNPSLLLFFNLFFFLFLFIFLLIVDF